MRTSYAKFVPPPVNVDQLAQPPEVRKAIGDLAQVWPEGDDFQSTRVDHDLGEYLVEVYSEGRKVDARFVKLEA